MTFSGSVVHSRELYERSVLDGRPGISPGKERVVGSPLHDLDLQSPERVLSLAVNCRHRYVEYTQKRVRLVFNPRRDALRGPRHAAGDADVLKGAMERQDLGIDPGDVLEQVRQPELGAKMLPVDGQEDEAVRRKELLKRPSSLEPPAPAEG